MRKVLLTRNETGPEGTFGRIATDGMFEATTLELPWLNNEPNKSCIPAGVYRCALVDSPSKGRVYEVRGSLLGGRTHILIHPANWSHQLLGCIAIGRAEGLVQDEKRGGAFRGIMSSRDAVIGFMNDLTDAQGLPEEFQLTVIWGPGVRWDKFEPGY
jgi:hypothetical protein